MKQLLSIVFLFASLLSLAQTGEISGIVLDKEYQNQPLPFADVYLKGTTKGASTDFEGKYTISNVPVGNQTVLVTFIGYETKEVVVLVESGKTAVVNATLSAGQTLTGVVVQGTSAVKESEAALLREQKKSVTIKQAIGAEELEKKAVSDAAAATLKVTGVNKKEGSNKIYVRGLGDRYNTTTLNGLPLPSNDPTNKNIDLSLFETGIIKSVGINKAFASNISGDVAGANIDILTKEIKRKSVFKIGVSTGVNTRSSFRSFSRIARSNDLGITQNVKHDVADLRIYDFEGSFTPESERANPNSGISLNYGRKFKVGEESSFSVFLVGSFNAKYNLLKGNSSNIIREGVVSSAFETTTFNYQTSKLFLANLGYKINANHKLAYNHILIQSNNQKIEDFFGGTSEEGLNEGDDNQVRLVLQTETQNLLFVNQLISKNKFGESIDVNGALGYSVIFNDEPARRRNSFLINKETGDAQLRQNATRDNSIYFGNLYESDISGYANVTKYFGERHEDDNKGKITLGYNGRFTDRQFDGIYFDHNFQGSRAVDINNLDATFNQENLSNGTFALSTSRGSGIFDNDIFLPQLYDADKTSHAVYLDLIYKVNENLVLDFGLRAEDVKLDVEFNTNISLPGFSDQGEIGLDDQYILPSLNIKYGLNEKSNLRFSGSVTYTYPQFKEIAPFTYEGINFQETGNPFLQPSDNYNGEIKYEFFPKRNEVLSFGVFGKFIDSSINRLERASAVERDFTFVNAGDATVFGAEIEARYDVIDNEVGDDKSHTLTLGGNATIMETELEFDIEATEEVGFTFTNDDSQLEGASPITINADISYKFSNLNKETVATLAFNFQSDKVFSIGTNFQENLVERGVPLLDFIFSHKFNKNLGIKFNAKNILDQSFERYRDISGDPVTNSFKKGATFTAGISYGF